MGQQYMVLNYATMSILRWFTSDEICTVCKALMMQPGPSFDVLTSNFEQVTADFEQREGGKWIYNPRPRVEQAR